MLSSECLTLLSLVMEGKSGVNIDIAAILFLSGIIGLPFVLLQLHSESTQIINVLIILKLFSEGLEIWLSS